MSAIEQQIAGLITWLRDNGHPNPQSILRRLDPAEVPEEFRGALAFWHTLSGPSRNLMYDVACGRRTRKQAPVRGRHTFKIGRQLNLI
jgi:hypothetical protein